NISAIVKVLKKKKFSGKIVIDPILKSTTGVRLISRDAISSLKKELFPLASMVTPNVSEAEKLSGVSISDSKSIKKAAHKILDLGPESVLITGYAARKGYLSDILVGKNGTRVMEYKK
ncbi:MAG TPA: bifunctional hydroxymethylpyrimidine kinase/phosphomethylpyrimidine kinase, partial [Muricauda sp.]|nr:bifunctional hydroxymethylpyrimidine kinase/phosphomethylpyrimidine kinase [Allomuricauda sp.]